MMFMWLTRAMCIPLSAGDFRCSLRNSFIFLKHCFDMWCIGVMVRRGRVCHFYLFINLPFYHVRLIVARGVQSYKVWDTWCRLHLKYSLILFKSRKKRHKVSVALEAIIYRMLCESSKPVGCWTQSVVESAGTCIDYRLRGSRLMVFAITEVMLSWRQRNQRWFCMINR